MENKDDFNRHGQRTQETDEDYMRLRHYRFMQGRFQTPDPVNGKTGMPLSFNLYSYGAGNPLKFYDPTGKMIQYFVYGDEQYASMGSYSSVLDVESPKEEKITKEQSDESKLPKEGDVIVREEEGTGAKDVAFVDRRDAQGRLLIFGFDRETRKAKLVALGSNEDMFGNYKVIGVIDPKKEFSFTRTWQEAIPIFKEKYEGKLFGYKAGQFQCWELTNNLLYKTIIKVISLPKIYNNFPIFLRDLSYYASIVKNYKY